MIMDAPVVALNNDIAARLAERAAQDAKLFPPLTPSSSAVAPRASTVANQPR